MNQKTINNLHNLQSNIPAMTSKQWNNNHNSFNMQSMSNNHNNITQTMNNLTQLYTKELPKLISDTSNTTSTKCNQYIAPITNTIIET